MTSWTTSTASSTSLPTPSAEIVRELKEAADTALLRLVSPRHVGARPRPQDQIANASSSNAIADRRLAGSSTAVRNGPSNVLDEGMPALPPQVPHAPSFRRHPFTRLPHMVIGRPAVGSKPVLS